MFSTTVGQQQFMEEAGSEYDDAVEYTLVRWLNIGAALSRLFHLGNGIDIFTMKQGKTVP
jgi:succinate dehydrogenase/fumarate reductase cytochrome b subunit